MRKSNHPPHFLQRIFTVPAPANPERPLPSPGEQGHFLKTQDGTDIYVYTYQPRPVPGLSLYILSGITGINHLAEKDLIESLSAGKHRVVVVHPRGTGYSAGNRGDIRNFSAFITDYIEVIKADSVLNTKGHSLILFGHSMSSAVALQVAQKLENPAGIILVNPPCKLKKAKGMSPGWREYLKYIFYSLFAPHTPIVNMAGDPALIKGEAERREAEARQRDPLLVKYFSMYCMFNAGKIMGQMKSLARSMKSPLMLIYGLEDSLVEKHGCDILFHTWGSSQKEYLLVDKGPHGKLTVFKAQAAIHAWLALIEQ